MEILSFMITILSLIVGVCTLCATKKIAFVQQWNSLVTEYRSHEFGEALKAVCEFFTYECGSCIENVQEKYEEQTRKLSKTQDDSVENKCCSVKKSLCFSRRMLAQYYWQLWVCLETESVNTADWIKKYFNKNEMNIMAVIYQMNIAEGRNYMSIWKNSSVDRDVFENKYEINKCIENLYNKFNDVFEDDKRQPQPITK